jgi:hypothetical protein
MAVAEPCDICAKLTDEVKQSMNELLEASFKTGREHALKICSNSKILPTEKCVGATCEIPIIEFDKLKCPKGTNVIGAFHTHPSEEAYPSIGDISSASDYDIKNYCIGGREVTDGITHKVVRCFKTPSDTIRLRKNATIKYNNLEKKVIEYTGWKSWENPVDRKDVKTDTQWNEIEELNKNVHKARRLAKASEKNLSKLFNSEDPSIKDYWCEVTLSD